MTPMAKLLRQTPTLCRRAFEHTRDVNEAYLLVHDLVARAVGRDFGDQDADLALTNALAERPNLAINPSGQT
jgi:hypothetical protein